MKHIKNIEIINDTKGNVINRITTKKGIVIETDRIKYPDIEKTIEQIDFMSDAIKQIIINMFENAQITLDPKTGKITIKFQT